VELNSRRQLFRATLGFLAFEPRELELPLLHRWFGAPSPWVAVQRSQSLESLPSAIRTERRSRPAPPVDGTL